MITTKVTKVGGNDMSEGQLWRNTRNLRSVLIFPDYGDCFARLGR